MQCPKENGVELKEDKSIVVLDVECFLKMRSSYLYLQGYLYDFPKQEITQEHK